MSVKFTSKGLADGTDDTKELEFNIAGVTTGTTRTITIPDGDTKLYTGDGTSGQILTSNGAGTAPTFQAAAAAGANTSLSNLSATGEQRVCQAWVNFNGTGTVSISDSYNVSSIGDSAVGRFLVNFSNNMSNALYSVTAANWQGTTSSGYYIAAAGAIDTGSCRCACFWTTGSGADVDKNSVQVFGD